MDAAMAERFPVLAWGASIHSSMTKFCRKLDRLHLRIQCPVRRLVLGVGSEGHRAAPSIWRGSRLKWFEPEAPARECARRRLVESTAEAVAQNLIHATAGHKGRSAYRSLGAINESAAAA